LTVANIAPQYLLETSPPFEAVVEKPQLIIGWLLIETCYHDAIIFRVTPDANAG